MSDNNALINSGSLSKPATILIKKISNAVGVLYEPTRIRRQAKAEADAEKIKALAHLELTSLQERAIERLVHQEARQQQNIEDITAQAIAQLGEEACPDQLNEDWIAHFFKQCETVSDKEMQTLWLKILVAEATKPTTFSKRTVNFVASMDKKDAALFTALGQFVWSLENEPIAVVFDTSSDFLEIRGLTYTTFKHLDAIGLISFQPITGYQAGSLPKHTTLVYYGRSVLIEFPQDTDNRLGLGEVFLTTVGRELFPICGAGLNEDYFRFVLQHWRSRGLKLTTPGYADPEAQLFVPADGLQS